MQFIFDHRQEEGAAERDRRLIALKLEAFEPLIASSWSSDESKPGCFMSQTTEGRTTISFWEMTTQYVVPDKDKAIARLDRCKLFPIVGAASSWRSDFAVGQVLENHLWRDRVFELCQVIGHRLPEHRADELRRPGSYYASHAEKKLVAYYIGQHVILPSAVFTINEPGKWMQQNLGLQYSQCETRNAPGPEIFKAAI